MKKTRAECQREYEERKIKADPDYLIKERQRNKTIQGTNSSVEG